MNGWTIDMQKHTLDEAICVGKINKDTIQINGFLVHYFKGYEDELEGILIKAVLQNQKYDPDVVEKDVISYLEGD